MIVNEKHGNVAASETLVPVEFGFELNAKAFEILSAGIYSDKVRAIIRELSTNAADAHVAAGNPNPFHVHLPNQLEPWFAVTDFGTGLSDEAIRGTLVNNTRKGGIYTTYFKSNKTHSNDFTGCLGLGSKSPFAYTDSFTVESRQDGTKRIYSAFLSEQRVPTVTLMSEIPTTEHNGLTIQFPVKSSDIWAFQNKAVETLQWFQIKPTITGYHGFQYPQKDYLLKTNEFAVRQEHSGYSYVVMGNIAYPIDANEFLHGYETLTEKLKTLVRWGVEIYVNVGDVDIAASREKLSYDKHTTNFLKQKCIDILKTLETEVAKKISQQPTLWQARIALHKTRKSFQGFDLKAEWNGNTIQPFVKANPVEIIKDDGSKSFSLPANIETLCVKNHRSANRLVIKREKAESLHADETIVFLNDERGAIAKIRYFLDDKPKNTKVYLVSDYSQEWLQQTGLSEVAIKASSLPQIPRTTNTTRVAAQKAKVYQFVTLGNANNGSSQAAGYWEPAEIDLDDGGVYVEILYFNYRMKDGEPTQNPSFLREPLNLLDKLGKTTKLYGIRPVDKTLLDKSEGDWLTLKEYAIETAKELQNTYETDLIKIKQLFEAFGDPKYNSSTFDWYGKLVSQNLNPNSKMIEFVSKLLEAKQAYENQNAKTYGKLLEWTQTPFECKQLNLLHDLEQETLNHYPMLKWIERSNYRSIERLPDVVDYINLIDNQTNQQTNAA